MLSEEYLEKLAEILVDRIEELNTTILEEIGKSIKEIGKLTVSQAYQIIQSLKYGSSYTRIIKKLAEVSKLNEKDIYKIFDIIAEDNQYFAEQFYNYRGIDFIPYSENEELQRQVKAMAKITSNEFKNLMNTTGMILDNNFVPLSKIYSDVLDKAVIDLSQGRETYQQIMRKTMKEIAGNGIRTRIKTNTKVVDYPTGYSRRLDSAVRMNLLDGMRNVSNELQKQFGEEFGADGVEISVHENPAPDHADIQGKQFSNEEFEELNEHLHRPISTMNCYHKTFSIILGISKPEYSQEELDAINKRNQDGFNFEGKHYTMYEGTQLQRQLETKIRTLKDRQIGARAMGDIEEVDNCQRRIKQLTHKYNDLSLASGLKPKKQRLSVSGYMRVKV